MASRVCSAYHTSSACFMLIRSVVERPDAQRRARGAATSRIAAVPSG